MLNTLKKLILKEEQDIGGIRKNSEKWESLFFFLFKDRRDLSIFPW